MTAPLEPINPDHQLPPRIQSCLLKWGFECQPSLLEGLHSIIRSATPLLGCFAESKTVLSSGEVKAVIWAWVNGFAGCWTRLFWLKP